MSDNPALNGRPVIIVHMEHPPDSGLTACSGDPFTPASADSYPNVPRVACIGCTRPQN